MLLELEHGNVPPTVLHMSEVGVDVATRPVLHTGDGGGGGGGLTPTSPKSFKVIVQEVEPQPPTHFIRTNDPSPFTFGSYQL